MKFKTIPSGIILLKKPGLASLELEPGFFHAMAINMCDFKFSKNVDGNLATLKNGMNKAVAILSLSEREHSPIKFVLLK